MPYFSPVVSSFFFLRQHGKFLISGRKVLRSLPAHTAMENSLTVPDKKFPRARNYVNNYNDLRAGMMSGTSRAVVVKHHTGPSPGGGAPPVSGADKDNGRRTAPSDIVINATNKICDVYGPNAVSVREPQNWFKRFHGNFNVKDEPLPGRPVTDKVDANLENVEQGRHIGSYDIAEELGIEQKQAGGSRLVLPIKIG
ncbi:hypothetical protein EVAR_56191_1 [Eumeta japonica]|uniref:Mos1 transposase HTH domain-containing protein n=1 Tax=Eumeta variegata TaxID=151549 RepID=A0A4C1Y7Z8_EUMVA|nr:hypothetical protein EVAR_56191_1 [Eumeta japonica]